MSETVQLKIENQIAHVTLVRPDIRNAFNPEMIASLTNSFKKISSDANIRAVVLSGDGKVFCAGADLNWMKSMVNFSLQENKKDSAQLFDMFNAIYNCPCPVIGMVQGAAFGGALGLMACCDVVIADENAKLCFSEVKIGIAPAVISAFVLKKTTLGHVGHLMMTGLEFSAAEAKNLGLAHFVVPVEKMQVEKDKVLKSILESGPEAVRATKKLIKDVAQSDVGVLKEVTTEVIAERRVSQEGQAGLKSFLDKSNPPWKKQVST